MDFEINTFNSHLDSLAQLDCQLSLRQAKICEFLCLGMNVPDIARTLYKSNRTIENQIQQIKVKTKIPSTASIICWYASKNMLKKE